jgi:hypothetical protein
MNTLFSRQTASNQAAISMHDISLFVALFYHVASYEKIVPMRITDFD